MRVYKKDHMKGPAAHNAANCKLQSKGSLKTRRALARTRLEGCTDSREPGHERPRTLSRKPHPLPGPVIEFAGGGVGDFGAGVRNSCG